MDRSGQRDLVLESHASTRAISALLAWDASAILDARFEYRELTLWIGRDSLRAAAETLRDAGYNFLADVTCVDLYPAEPRFHLTCHLLSLGLKERLRLVTPIDSVDPVAPSLTPVWPAANFYEREVWDLFGVRFSGHPNLRRIMMPDEWEGHPLRKDYPVEGYR